MRFDLIAPVYDWLAHLVFSDTLEQAQRATWQGIEPNATLLILGGGTGTFLPDLMAEKRPRSVCYLDTSAAMLQRAEARLLTNVPVEFRHGDQTRLLPGEQFDYILLPFVLDLYPTHTLREQILPSILAALKPGGALLITDFDRPVTHWQRLQMQLMLWFFRLVANIPVRQWPDWPGTLQQLGYAETDRHTFRGDQVRSGRWRRAS